MEKIDENQLLIEPSKNTRKKAKTSYKVADLELKKSSKKA